MKEVTFKIHDNFYLKEKPEKFDFPANSEQFDVDTDGKASQKANQNVLKSSKKRLSLPVNLESVDYVRRSGRRTKAPARFSTIIPEQQESIDSKSSIKRRWSQIGFEDDKSETNICDATSTTLSAYSKSSQSSILSGSSLGNYSKKNTWKNALRAGTRRKTAAKIFADNNTVKIGQEIIQEANQNHDGLRFVDRLFKPNPEAPIINPNILFSNVQRKIIAKRTLMDGREEYLYC